jgi:hypothetical protein
MAIIRQIKHKNHLSVMLFLLLIFLSMIEISYGAGGMTEFNKISTWVQDNLQGTLGKAISFLCLLALVGNLMTNPNKAVIAAFGAPLAAIWIGPALINALF